MNTFDFNIEISAVIFSQLLYEQDTVYLVLVISVSPITVAAHSKA
jgi:hypothetical protein